MHRNSLIALLVCTILVISSVIYYNSNRSQYVYHKYRGNIMTFLPDTRTRSTESSNSDIVRLEYALSDKKYDLALRHLSQMIEEDSNNLTLQFYRAVLCEQLGHDLQAIDYYQKVRFNSDLFDNQSIRQLILLYVKLKEKKRAEEMLAELIEIGDDEDQSWAREIAQIL